MEANTKQQQLTYEKGITNVPSDLLCSDNTLSNAENLIYRDGEHRVIQKPAQVTGIDFSDVGKLLLVHHVGNGSVKYISHLSNYIYSVVDSSHKTAINDTPISGTPTASVCGNFLIIKDNNGTRYYLWKDDVATHDGYVNIGKILPELNVEFQIGTSSSSSSSSNSSGNFAGAGDSERSRGQVSNSQSAEGIFSSDTTLAIALGKQEAYNNLVVGLYNKNLKAIADNKCFCEPFMVCAAIELYDGSYVMPTAPQLLFPAIRYNSYAIYWPQEKEVRITTRCEKLYFKASFDYSNYSELVKDVVVFFTDGAKLYDTTIDQKATVVTDQQTTVRYWDYIRDGSFSYQYIPSGGHASGVFFKPLFNREDDEILDDIKSNGIFYKAFSLGITRDETNWTDASKLINRHTLNTLVTQEQLPIDYFSHCSLSADTMKVLNQRLHLGGVYRGYAPITGNYFSYGTGGTYDIYVEISTSNGTRLIKQSVTLNGIPGFYFYYPDPRAKKAYIVNGSHQYIEMPLKEHPCLNGAYYIKALPTGDDSTTPSGSFTLQENNTPERLYNQLYVSEANNPFVFKPDGVVAVGVGNIIELASTTQALSEGQFGQFPLVVFTSEGMWALSMDSTGVYKTAHPMSREVILANTSALQTDGAIFFVSKKGLMEIVGSQVLCVSEQLSGRNATLDFQSLFASCFMAYDYRDSLIWIFPKTSITGFTSKALVFSIKSRSFSTVTFTSTLPTTAVSNYPDYLLQISSTIYTLTGRSNINSDSSPYSATLVTRPLKLENALALKTITQLRHIGQFNAGQASVLTLHIFASNNLNNPDDWTELHSLRGQPWKYYRFQYDFTNLKATDTFAGSVLITQERRTDKLR